MFELDRKPVSWLYGNLWKPNLVSELPEQFVSWLGSSVLHGYERDRDSRADWEKQTEEGLNLAMQVRESKTFPWPNAANVKHPLMATAAIQFAARAYPEIVKGKDVVKALVVGEDPQGLKEARARRVSGHMSFQLTDQMPEWEEDTDKLLHALPVLGMYYRKTYRDDMLRRNVSEGRSPLDIVVNNDVKSLSVARRVTDAGIWLYKNQVIERERSGLFVEDIHSRFSWDDEEKEPQQFLEQHCFADLDGDGYEEPYIVTIHKETGLVCRIVVRYDETGIELDGSRENVVRIEPVQYFTKYTFIPAPNGQYHDLGFAQLLGPLNETINTLVNQLLDAGTLSNLQSGFIGKGLRWQGGVLRFTPGEWKPVDVPGGVLKDNIVPMPIREPSGVLFTLLGALTEATDRLASVSEAMAGEYPAQNTPATTVLAMIEQGLKVFTSIYKRVFRSLKSEYKKLYRLNRLYLDETEYYNIADSPEAVFKSDYDEKGLDVIPVADPTVSSEAQRMARGRALMETLGANPSPSGRVEILSRYYRALDAPQVEKLLPPEEIKQILSNPPPDPKMVEIQAKILQQKSDYQHAEEKLAMEREKLNLETEMAKANIELIKANAIKAIAEAEAKEIGQQFEIYRGQVEQLSRHVELAIKAKDAQTKAQAMTMKGGSGDAGSGNMPEPDAGGVGGVEAGAPDAGSVPGAAPAAGGLPVPVSGDGSGEPVVGGEDVAGMRPAVGRPVRLGPAAGNSVP